MQVLAALGDAATAAIAVVAILLGVLLAARGPREKRAAAPADESEPAPTLLKVPIAAAADVEPGFVGPEGSIVGHGPIRLGATGPLSAGEPDPPPPPSAPAVVESEPQAPPAPGPVAAPANDAVRFRQGTIKLGGRSAGKPEND